MRADGFPILVAAALSIAGCAHVTPHFSTLGYDPNTMEIVGPASAAVTHQYLFGLGPLGGKEAESFAIAAYDQAVKSAGADALVNVVADESFRMTLGFILYSRTVTVRGLAVRFKK